MTDSFSLHDKVINRRYGMRVIISSKRDLEKKSSKSESLTFFPLKLDLKRKTICVGDGSRFTYKNIF